MDIFTAVVIASVGVALAGLTWRVAGDPGTSLSAAPPVAARREPPDITALVALAPFGTAQASVAAAPATLELRGIFMANPVEASSALIATDGGTVTSFGLGQTIGNATIEAIAVDHVVLRTAGELQTLGFPIRKSDGAPASDATTAVVKAAPAVAAPPAPSVPTIAAPTPSGAEAAVPQPAKPARGAAAIRALIPQGARGESAPAPGPTGALDLPLLDSPGALPRVGPTRAADKSMTNNGIRVAAQGEARVRTMEDETSQQVHG